MKNPTPVVAGALLMFALAVGSLSARVPGQPQPLAQAQVPQAEAQTARGELTAVDATAKVLTIKPNEGAEQKFQYTDMTQVTGARDGVAGLATMSGKQVLVRFTMQGANRVASEIELQPEK